MKKTITSLLLLLVAIAAQAQIERNVVYPCLRGNITYTPPQAQKESTAKTVGKIIGSVLQASAGTAENTTDLPQYANAVCEAIIGAVGQARRVDMADAAVSGDALCLDASVSAITASSRVKTWTDKDGKNHEKTEYRGNITGTINIKSATTGSILYSQTINSSAWADAWFEATDKAVGYAISRMKQSITASVNNAFPLYASIVEGARDKKDKTKEVYIDLGEAQRCTPGIHFTVYTVRTVAGKEAKKKIGQLRVTEVMGDEVSLCKVQRGGQDIKTALDAGEKLLITSND